MNSIILGYILYYSQLYHVNPNLVKAVVHVESRGISERVGAAGEVGVMQLMPIYFRYDIEKLKKPRLNIAVGVAHLAKMRKQCPHQVDFTWVVCYNLGVAGAKRVKYPSKWPYYKKVMREYKRLEREEYAIKDLSIQNGLTERQRNR